MNKADIRKVRKAIDVLHEDDGWDVGMQILCSLRDGGVEAPKCHWWEHQEVGRLRGALLELYESWKDLARACGETCFVEAPEDTYKRTKQHADRAQKRTEKVLKQTAIEL